MSVENFHGGVLPQQRAFDKADEINGVTFASDHGRAKQYFVAPPSDAMNAHEAMHDFIFTKSLVDRTFYEVLRDGTPCKLYYDLEIEVKHDLDDRGASLPCDGRSARMAAMMDKLQEDFIEASLKALKSKGGTGLDRDLEQDDVTVLYSDGLSSGHFKASRHIIIPAWFHSNHAGMKHFAHKVWTDLGKPLGFDKGVYTKNRCFERR